MGNIRIDAKINLSRNYIENQIYEFSETEVDDFNKLKEYLKEDYGFFDIVLNFSDFYRLYNLIDDIPDKLDKNAVTGVIINQYLNYKILKQANIDTFAAYNRNLKSLEQDLFSGSFDQIKNTRWLNFNQTLKDLEIKGKTSRMGYSRIHFMLDTVNDKILQTKINDLFYNRSRVTMMAYTTKEMLTKEISNGDILDNNRDFKEFISEQRLSEMKKEGMSR